MGTGRAGAGSRLAPLLGPTDISSDGEGSQRKASGGGPDVWSPGQDPGCLGLRAAADTIPPKHPPSSHVNHRTLGS